jgi:hypothetical protein
MCAPVVLFAAAAADVGVVLAVVVLTVYQV